MASCATFGLRAAIASSTSLCAAGRPSNESLEIRWLTGGRRRSGCPSAEAAHCARRREWRDGSGDRRRWRRLPGWSAASIVGEGRGDLGDLRLACPLCGKRRRLRLDHQADLEELAEELRRRHALYSASSALRHRAGSSGSAAARGCRCGCAIRSGPWPRATSPPRGSPSGWRRTPGRDRLRSGRATPGLKSPRTMRLPSSSTHMGEQIALCGRLRRAGAAASLRCHIIRIARQWRLTSVSIIYQIIR